MTADEKKRYKTAYCGLCRRLRLDYGNVGRAELSYDMTFVALLLGSAYGLDETRGFERCVMRPIRPHEYIETEATAYAAAMNVMLAYYKQLDDWNDDRIAGARKKARALGAFMPTINSAWPAQTERARDCLEALAKMEQANEMNPDLPANCFGKLLGEVFDWAPAGGAAETAASVTSTATAEAVKTATSATSAAAATGTKSASASATAPTRRERLKRMGEALGRFIYLMDACVDLRQDIKKERYNPLVSEVGTDYEKTLSVMIGECAEAFESDPPIRDAGLLRNVIYSGVWTLYRMRRVGKRGKENA